MSSLECRKTFLEVVQSSKWMPAAKRSQSLPVGDLLQETGVRILPPRAQRYKAQAHKTGDASFVSDAGIAGRGPGQDILESGWPLFSILAAVAEKLRVPKNSCASSLLEPFVETFDNAIAVSTHQCAAVLLEASLVACPEAVASALVALADNLRTTMWQQPNRYYHFTSTLPERQPKEDDVDALLTRAEALLRRGNGSGGNAWRFLTSPWPFWRLLDRLGAKEVVNVTSDSSWFWMHVFPHRVRSDGLISNRIRGTSQEYHRHKTEFEQDTPQKFHEIPGIWPTDNEEIASIDASFGVLKLLQCNSPERVCARLPGFPMDELNLSVCVLDAGSMAEENLDPFELVSRIRAAVLRLQQDGLKVIVVDPKDDHWERLKQPDGPQPAIDFSNCTFVSAYNEPTILDALEAAENHDFSFYATSFDVESLIADWRLPQSTQDWLQSYRQRLEVIFHFDQGTFHLTWPYERTWPAPAVPGAEPEKNGKANSYVNEDGGKSYYPRPGGASKKGSPKTKPDNEGPLLAAGPLSIVDLPTGWYSDSQDPNMVHQMAVFPHKVTGGLQPVLAILSHSEKETLLQSAALMCSSLNGKFEEEEDLQQWMDGVIPGPWSDQGWTSHVVYAAGGELDGLWVVGAGARKQARRRAAKLAMVVAEKASRNSIVIDWPELQRLVERAKDLMEHARAKHAQEVEFPTPLSWLMEAPIASPEV
eukprot:s1737_g6.t1